MKGTALAVFVALLAVAATAANAYEFKLLNGMDLKGKLVSFSDGVFNVDTEFGSVTIEADKLDYIIVEEADQGPCSQKQAGAPGLGLEKPGQQPVMLASSDTEAAPAPLLCHSVPPGALMGHSIGTFRGGSGGGTFLGTGN